jgi:hypothetical protein
VGLDHDLADTTPSTDATGTSQPPSKALANLPDSGIVLNSMSLASLDDFGADRANWARKQVPPIEIPVNFTDEFVSGGGDLIKVPGAGALLGQHAARYRPSRLN